MNRQQLEHIVRAASAISYSDVVTVFGRAAIHGEHPELPAELCESMVAEVETIGIPEYMALIDATLGQGSAFHRMFGYYAHGLFGVSRDLPEDWTWRTTLFATRAMGGAIVRCMEVHDVAAWVPARGREDDVAFVGAMLRHGLVTAALVKQRIGMTRVSMGEKAVRERRVERAAGLSV